MGDRKHLFVSNRAANTISIIDMDNLSVVRSFATPSGPDCMEVSKDGKELWVTARWARVVAVVDIASGKVIKTVPVGRSPHGVWFRSHAARN
jgi:YVTN family beta-propeller protein